MEETFIQCPYCLENISVLLDTGVEDGRMNIVDDCEVCCRPIEINYKVKEYELVDFSYQSIEGNEF